MLGISPQDTDPRLHCRGPTLGGGCCFGCANKTIDQHNDLLQFARIYIYLKHTEVVSTQPMAGGGESFLEPGLLPDGLQDGTAPVTGAGLLGDHLELLPHLTEVVLGQAGAVLIHDLAHHGDHLPEAPSLGHGVGLPSGPAVTKELEWIIAAARKVTWTAAQ